MIRRVSAKPLEKPSYDEEVDVEGGEVGPGGDVVGVVECVENPPGVRLD